MKSIILCSFTLLLFSCGYNQRHGYPLDAGGDTIRRDGELNRRDVLSDRDAADAHGDQYNDASTSECVSDCECTGNAGNCFAGQCIENGWARLGLCGPDGDCQCINGRCDERQCCIKPDGEVATFLSPECTGADPRKMELACDELVWGCPTEKPYCCDTYRDDDPGPKLCYDEPVVWEMMYGICIERTPDGMEARCELEYRNCPPARPHCCGLYRDAALQDSFVEVCADHPVRGWRCSSPP